VVLDCKLGGALKPATEIHQPLSSPTCGAGIFLEQLHESVCGLTQKQQTMFGPPAEQLCGFVGCFTTPPDAKILAESGPALIARGVPFATHNGLADQTGPCLRYARRRMPPRVFPPGRRGQASFLVPIVCVSWSPALFDGHKRFRGSKKAAQDDA